METVSDKYKWKFFKAGGVIQTLIESGADLSNLRNLDNKYWVALSCPTSSLYFDNKTLEFLDSDKNGRIHSSELVSTCEWAISLLKSPDTLLKSSSVLNFDEINSSTAEGKKILEAAQNILNNLGKTDVRQISLDDVDEDKIFKNSKFNGDGIIWDASCDSDESKKVLTEIISAFGAIKDKSGNDGVSIDLVEKFYAQLRTFSDWANIAKSDAAILPFGADTEAASLAYLALESKIDEFFAVEILKEFDEKLYSDKFILANGDFAVGLRSMPISKIAGTGILDFSNSVNPAWVAELEAFRLNLLCKNFGADKNTLSKQEWMLIKAKLAPYLSWKAAKPSTSVESVAPERMMKILSDNLESEFKKLIDLDLAQKENVEAIECVEKLVRLNRYLKEFLCNFVNFKDFYSEKSLAIFQYGRLFLDRRECVLCIKVDDMAKHATIAPMSYSFLAYCACTRPDMPPMTILAAFTSGDSDSIFVGRNGLFYDREGRDWDATIVKVVENPISISQAFWAPYKRLIKWVTEFITKRASAADTNVGDKLQGQVASAAEKPAADAAAPKKMDIGTVAAIGVAFGSITTAFGFLIKALLDLGVWLPLGILP